MLNIWCTHWFRNLKHHTFPFPPTHVQLCFTNLCRTLHTHTHTPDSNIVCMHNDCMHNFDCVCTHTIPRLMSSCVYTRTYASHLSDQAFTRHVRFTAAAIVRQRCRPLCCPLLMRPTPTRITATATWAVGSCARMDASAGARSILNLG